MKTNIARSVIACCSILLSGCATRTAKHAVASSMGDVYPVDRRDSHAEAYGAAPAIERSRDARPVSSTISGFAIDYQKGNPDHQARFDESAAKGNSDLANTAAAQRIVVYEANYNIATTDTDAVKKVAQIANEVGGYVAVSTGETITIRVPVKSYADAISRIEKIGEVRHHVQKALDVTEEHVDLEARLKNARVVRERLVALLEKAANVSETLEVEKELKRVNEEIETIQAKLELLQKRVAFSSITVTFSVRTPAVAGVDQRDLPFAWLRELRAELLFR